MSKKRLIYHEFTGKHQIKIVEYLFEKYGWEPVMMTGHNVNFIQDWMNMNYPSVILQDTLRLRQAQFDYSKIGTPVPIDASIISSLSKCELNFLANMADPTGWNYSFTERRSFYYDILKYWNTIIHHLQPDLFVSFTLPHTATCHSLYLICKYHYSIDVLFLNPVPLFNKNYHVISRSIETPYAQCMELYESAEAIAPGTEVKENLTEVRSKRGRTPQYILDTLEKDKKYSQIFRIKSFISLIKSFISLIKSTIKDGTGFRKGQWDWKKNKKPYYLIESRMNYFGHFLFRNDIRRKNEKLRNYYMPLCVEPNFKKKYLYFAASYQPEATTVINAGVYEDFFLVLDILSSVLPEDWIIYYKENPYTFYGSSLGSLKRDKYYFERINSYKNIKMVSSDISTFELIDGAQAVATVSGTVAWEAVVRGKPALSFGNAWYMGCKSIFWIKTLQDAKNAMEKIVNGFTPDQTDIERYAAAIEKVAVKGMIHQNFDESIKKCKDPKYEMERISKALYNAYIQHYSKNKCNVM